MILNLSACVVFLAAIVTAVATVGRKLRVAGEAVAGEPVCQGCRTPARLLTPGSFVCPGCHRDVRQLGIGIDRPKGLTSPFWHVVSFTAILCVIALVTTGVLSSVHRRTYVTTRTDLQFTGEAYQSVELLLTGRRSANGPLNGELYADMFLSNGQVVTLVIDSPSRRYRLIDSDGHEWPSQESFGEDAALRWLSMAGLNAAEARQQAGWIRAQIENLLIGNSAFTFRSSDARPHYTGGGGSSSSRGGGSDTLLPLSVMGWSLAWVVGVMVIVRGRAAPAFTKRGAAA